MVPKGIWLCESKGGFAGAVHKKTPSFGLQSCPPQLCPLFAPTDTSVTKRVF